MYTILQNGPAPPFEQPLKFTCFRFSYPYPVDQCRGSVCASLVIGSQMPLNPGTCFSKSSREPPSLARMSGFQSALRPYEAVIDSDLEVDEEDMVTDSDSDEIEYLGTRPRDFPRVGSDDEDEEVVYLGTRPRNLARRHPSGLPDSNSVPSKLPARRKKISGECPICYEEFEPKNEEIVWCKATCGNNVHKACFEAWRQRHSPEELCCVFWYVPKLRLGSSFAKC